jgi:hypothetical protein
MQRDNQTAANASYSTHLLRVKSVSEREPDADSNVRLLINATQYRALQM